MMSDEMLAALERLAAMPDELLILGPHEDDAFLSELRVLAHHKYAKGRIAFDGSYACVLSSAGKEALRLERELRKKQAEDEEHQRALEKLQDERWRKDFGQRKAHFVLRILIDVLMFSAGVYFQWCFDIIGRLWGS